MVFNMKKTLFIKNAAILTVSSLILRFIGIVFKVWLAGEIGAEGIGLYQLIFSVYTFVSTFATSGICTAVTRLTADELALGSKKTTLKIMRRCIQLTLIIAAITVMILLFGANFISKFILGDIRAASSIKILSLSLPFMGISSCLRGYFIARRKTAPASSSQIFEQIVRIAVIMLLVKQYAARGLEFACAAVLIGDTVGEAVSCLYMYLKYIADKRGLNSLSGRKNTPYSVIGAISHIALPITAGRYLNSGLRTAENLLVPKALSKHALSGDNALSLFGMIKGMALPILFFPSTLLNSLSILLIPEMSEAMSLGRKGVVKCVIEQILKITSIISFIFAAIFLVAGKQIGYLLYKSADVGFLLVALSPIVPLMYLDSIADGLLKGLDQQNFTFLTAVGDSSLRIVLVLCVLPLWGINGFIAVMYFSNLFTCILHVTRLVKISGAKLNAPKNIFIPLCCAVTVALLLNSLLRLLKINSILVYITLLCVASLLTYCALLFAFGIIDTDDFYGMIKR